MIIGIGTDIVSLGRVRRSLERFGRRFACKALCGEELGFLPSGEAAVAFLAGRWAAKEAFVKALGTGFRQGVAPTSVCVLNDPLGKPVLRASGEAGRKLEELGATAVHVSISHERENAVAFVVLEKGSPPAP